MTPSRISLLRPDMPGRAELEPFLAGMDDARWYTNFGPLLRGFEEEVRAAIPGGASGVVAVANGTQALELALLAFGLPRGARVLVPAFTFVATAAAVLRAGYELVVADIDPASWVLTPALAHAAMKTHRIDCVLPVAALGNPLPASEWDEFQVQTGKPVLLDAAGAMGNQAAGERIVVMFSLHATKTLGIGEGGLLVTGDEPFLNRVRRLCNFGIDVTTGLAAQAGTNAKLSEYHAAVGLAALKRWPARRRLRQQLHADYCKALSRHCPQVSLQARPVNGAYSVLQVLLPRGMQRARVMSTLAAANIETRAWYQPLIPDHPAFASATTGELPVARALAERMLGVPFHLDLTAKDISRVCTVLAQALAEQESS